jgi:hypothetical protein
VSVTSPISSRICRVTTCEDYVHAQNRCHAHYQSMMRSGKLSPLPVVSPATRLAAHLVRMPNGCLEWTGGTDKDGYGRIYANGKHVLVHRLAWKLTHGPIPQGLEVCHHCDNPPCCDAEKCLFLGTHADNMADMKAKGHVRGWDKDVTHCPYNHPYAGANLYVDPKGKRYCRQCRRDRDVLRYWRDRALAVAS